MEIASHNLSHNTCSLCHAYVMCRRPEKHGSPQEKIMGQPKFIANSFLRIERCKTDTKTLTWVFLSMAANWPHRVGVSVCHLAFLF